MLLDENLSEKVSTTFIDVKINAVEEFEAFIEEKDLEKKVLFISFISMVVVIGSIII